MPFNIFGIVIDKKEDYIYSQAFDKHIGKTIGIEFYMNKGKKNMISLYLYNGACTNTVKRFLNNFRHFIDPAASFDGDDYD